MIHNLVPILIVQYGPLGFNAALVRMEHSITIAFVVFSYLETAYY